VNKNSPYVILSEQICLVEIFVIPFIVEIFFVPFIVEIFVQRFSDINQKKLAGMNFGGNFMIFFVPFIVEIFVQRFSDINQKNW
jgi:hypothetical protein